MPSFANCAQPAAALRDFLFLLLGGRQVAPGDERDVPQLSRSGENLRLLFERRGSSAVKFAERAENAPAKIKRLTYLPMCTIATRVSFFTDFELSMASREKKRIFRPRAAFAFPCDEGPKGDKGNLRKQKKR